MKLAIAYCYRGSVLECFMKSMLQCVAGAGDINLGQIIGIETLYLPEGRNAAVKSFLLGDCHAMLFVDTDITFTPEHVREMIRFHATHHYAVLAGCYLQYVSHDGETQPHWYLETEPPPMTPVTPLGVEGVFRDNDVLPIKGCGMGFTLIPRAVVVDARWEGQWFGGKGREVNDGGFTGEDIFFCRKAVALGHPIVAVPVKVGHTKSRVL